MASINFVSVFEIKNQFDIIHGDGQIGLSPRLPAAANEKESRDSVIQKFFDSGSIKKNMFSLHLKPDDSRLIIGGYSEDAIALAGTKRTGTDDLSKERTPDGIFWMYLNSNIYWSVDLQ